MDAHYPLQIVAAKELPFHHRKVGQGKVLGEVLLLHLPVEELTQELWNPLCLPLLVADGEMESSTSPLPRHYGVSPGVADSVLP